MFREAKSRKDAAPPCAVCGSPGTNGFWDTQLCDGCYRSWWAEAPNVAALELAHADAHPTDVAHRGEYQYRGTGQTLERWVILKDGVSERLAREAAQAWVQRNRKRGAA